MQFNTGTNSLYADALFWSGANATSFPVDPDFTRSANAWLDIVVSWILRADNTQQFDDTNLSTELLDTTTNLVAGTPKYAISSAWLKIGRVRIKDPNGNWVTLEPVDRRQLSDSDISASGTPRRYDKLGNYIYPFPIPNYASTGGMEVQRQRVMDYFVVGDTTKAPGYAPQYHRIISWGAALDYVLANTIPNKAEGLRSMIGEPPDLSTGKPGFGMAKELVEFYADRDRDLKPSLSLEQDDYGGSALGDTYSSLPKGFIF